MEEIYSAEYVSNGHPDKLADLISDAILDAYLEKDKYAHVACETLISRNLIVIAGEIKSDIHNIKYKDVINKVLIECGYNNKESGFDVNNYQLITNLSRQSEDINNTVNNSYEYRHGESNCIIDKIGAGDQGIVIGYACNETKELMPLPQMIVKSYIEEIEYLRQQRILPYLRPVSKALITMKYENRKAKSIEDIVISVQHDENISNSDIEHDIISRVIQNGKYKRFFTERTKILVNPSGKFCVGGPKADTGITGRKIVMDAYGARVRHGGGALSGKDPSKVDRSGAYFARWIAKHIVGLGYADECEVELIYAIGVAKPINISINCHGTEKISINLIEKKVTENFDMRLYSVIKKLDLLKPHYYNATKLGHFGFCNKYLWECIDKKI
ncbi:methionine adenosyltransferase [Eubacterium sp.]